MPTQTLALAFAVLASCAAFAPRVGICNSPETVALAGWEPVACALDTQESLSNVRCLWRGERLIDGKIKTCRVWAATVGCGSWVEETAPVCGPAANTAKAVSL